MTFPTIFGVVTIGSLLAFCIPLIKSIRDEKRAKQDPLSKTNKDD